MRNGQARSVKGMEELHRNVVFLFGCGVNAARVSTTVHAFVPREKIQNRGIEGANIVISRSQNCSVAEVLRMRWRCLKYEGPVYVRY
jgi:hypothetical protein